MKFLYILCIKVQAKEIEIHCDNSKPSGTNTAYVTVGKLITRNHTTLDIGNAERLCEGAAARKSEGRR